MSLTKRIWLDKDPAYEDVRRAADASITEFVDEFVIKLAAKRKSRIPNTRYWDPFWHSSVLEAAKDLAIEIINVNGGFRCRTKEQRIAVLARAEAIWTARHAAWASRSPG